MTSSRWMRETPSSTTTRKKRRRSFVKNEQPTGSSVYFPRNKVSYFVVCGTSLKLQLLPRRSLQKQLIVLPLLCTTIKRMVAGGVKMESDATESLRLMSTSGAAQPPFGTKSKP